jgi:hypothetical protein
MKYLDRKFSVPVQVNISQAEWDAIWKKKKFNVPVTLEISEEEVDEILKAKEDKDKDKTLV